MATSNNEDSFPEDCRPESSDTESDQEGKILETHGITTTVHEMKVNGYHLVEKKQETLVDPKASDCTPKMTMMIHSRSISTDDPCIDDRSCVVYQNLTEDKEVLDRRVETEMTPEEAQRFEEDWWNLWKPQDKAELD
jgi:hypothetical protein